MTTAARQQPTIWKNIEVVAKFFFGSNHCKPTSRAPTEDAQARREFILEMMENNPDAFKSELDAQCMMHFYPSRF
jgi:hypothetical protein